MTIAPHRPDEVARRHLPSPAPPAQAPAPALAAARARACGGEAHGLRWDLDPLRTPPWTVDLQVAGTAVIYRMVLHPRTRRPARDRLGQYWYVPMEHAASPPDASQLASE